MDENKRQRAYELGIAAHKAGMPRIPALDSKLLKECISGNSVGEAVPYLNAWLRGWDGSNNAAVIVRAEVICRCSD